MAYNTKGIIADLTGKPVPQYYNRKNDKYEPIEGRDGANMFVQLGTIAGESWQGNAYITKTLPSERYGFSIENVGEGDISFTINGNICVVKQFEPYSALFD